jgi:hypothetical protein
VDLSFRRAEDCSPYQDREGAGAKYFNTPTTALYLDRNSPRYVGGTPVRSSNVNAVSRTLEFQKPNAVCRIASGLGKDVFAIHEVAMRQE